MGLSSHSCYSGRYSSRTGENYLDDNRVFDNFDLMFDSPGMHQESPGCTRTLLLRSTCTAGRHEVSDLLMRMGMCAECSRPLHSELGHQRARAIHQCLRSTPAAA